MRAEPQSSTNAPRWCLPAVFFAAIVGLALMADTARSISATYDEVTYLRVATRWWRTGQQSEITRMGSPLTFWKLQQVPVFWLLDRIGLRDLVDNPIGRQADLLPLVRFGSLWIWLLALGLTAAWSRALYGPRAMAYSAWLFALGPNVLAHGALVTMELPLLAASTATLFLFWRFLQSGRRWDFWGAAVCAGMAFSCKFTAVLLPPLLALAWWIDLWIAKKDRAIRLAWRIGTSMVGFTGVMLLADWAVTGFALLPLSLTNGGSHPSLDRWAVRAPELATILVRAYETPIPQDWVGFATQLSHQMSGGPSYLMGQTRMTGWWYYYFVALAVKVPLTFWPVVAARWKWVERQRSDRLLIVVIVSFLAITALGSTRNYGLRYLLPLTPLAIIWVSSLAEKSGACRSLACLGLAGSALAVLLVHPNELTYFNELARGPIGGRYVLADSNLDWGQGLLSLTRLQRERPEFRDLTLYYFGDTEPAHYGVAGTSYVVDAVNPARNLPAQLHAETRYMAVSTSLIWGPWGPRDYFKTLRGVRPVAMTDDTTILIYRAVTLPVEAQR